MHDLEKVNSSQLFSFWRNLSIGLLVLIGTLFLSWLLPFYYSPIVSLLAAALLYTLLYNNRFHHSSSCMVVPYSVFYCVIAYSFVIIILNILDIWDILKIPKELSFFNDPFIPALILNPVCFLVLLVFNLRRHRLAICMDCKISKGLSIERGKLGEILGAESRLQMRNLLVIFGLLTIVTWGYYYFAYLNININSRDNYVFIWLNIIVFILDELYFASRYYNIYLDLKENGEIISEDELKDMTTKTYLRIYAICGNHVFLNRRMPHPGDRSRVMTDTPYVTKRNVNGITVSEVNQIVRLLTGSVVGQLRFFYGRKSPDLAKHRVLRYFYFIDEVDGHLPEMNIDGEWIDFNELVAVYNNNPSEISNTMLTDMFRMVTVVLTQKIFDENGYRRMKVKTYRPSFDLTEIREKNYDFQDDTWIRISMFNSDMKGFHFRKVIDKIFGRRMDKNSSKWEEHR